MLVAVAAVEVGADADVLRIAGELADVVDVLADALDLQLEVGGLAPQVHPAGDHHDGVERHAQHATAVDDGFNLVKLANSFWSYGSAIALPIFQGGYRRAQLQQSWSAYRETEDRYRSTVLNAFREVENNLSLTDRLTAAAERQDAAVGATFKTQNLSMELYQGGLISSLDLIYAQVNTLIARIDSVEIKANLLKASVALIRALGGGWNRKQLPADEQIQPFDTFEYDYDKLEKPPPAGGIDVNAGKTWVNNDLTQPPIP